MSNTVPRSQQLCEDTLSTMAIANDMVTAMFENALETEELLRREIEQLTSRVQELEDLLAEVKSEWSSDSRTVHGSDTTVACETHIMRIDSMLLDSVME